jgi:hypothetical protein
MFAHIIGNEGYGPQFPTNYNILISIIIHTNKR